MFKFIDERNAFAFGYSNGNMFLWYEETLLPIGIDPVIHKAEAIIYLVRQYINSGTYVFRDALNYLYPAMRTWQMQHFINFFGSTEQKDETIIYLARQYVSNNNFMIRDILNCLYPAMRTWQMQHFTNFLGNTKQSDYSSDEEISPPREQITKQKINRTNAILESKGILKRDTLKTRLTGQVTKLRAGKKTNSDLLTEGVPERQGYFPKLQVSRSIQNELDWINCALSTNTNVRARLILTEGRKIIKIEGSYNGKSINHTMQHQYYLPFIRGINYLTDRWSKAARLAHRHLPMEQDFMHYSEAVLKTLDQDFYQLDSYVRVDFKQLHENARALKAKLLTLRTSPPTILPVPDKKDKNRKIEFRNFLEYLQYSFSNGIVNFLKHLEEFNQYFPNILPNNRTPFVPFSHLAFHALKYAFGDKNPYKDYVLPALWDRNGRCYKPYIGKLVISIHPLEDCLNLDEPDFVPYLNRTAGITLKQGVGSEYEVSFLSFIPKDRLFKTRIIRLPSFDKAYNPQSDLVDYGLTEELFEGFKFCILNPSLRDDAVEVLRSWLSLYHAIKAMHEVKDEIDSRQGVMIFRHPDGRYLTDYPDENFASTTSPLQASIEQLAQYHMNHHQAHAVFSDPNSYSEKRKVYEVDDPNIQAHQTPTKNILPRASFYSERSPVSPYSPVSSNSSFDEDEFSGMFAHSLNLDRDTPAAKTSMSPDASFRTARKSLIGTLNKVMLSPTKIEPNRYQSISAQSNLTDPNHLYTDSEIQAILRQLLDGNINVYGAQHPFLKTANGNDLFNHTLTQVFQSKKSSVIPINMTSQIVADYTPDAGTHWTGLVISYDPYQNSYFIEYMDSLDQQTGAKAIELLINQIASQHNVKIRFYWYKTEKQQNMDLDCGAWMVDNLIRRAQGLTLHTRTEISRQQLRREHHKIYQLVLLAQQGRRNSL